MDVKINFYSKDNNFIRTIIVPEEKRYNPRLRRKKSILDIGLDNNIDIKYGCMGGSCSACICEVISGEEYVEIGGIKEQVYKTEGKKFLSCMATIKEELPQNAEVSIKLGL